MVERRRLHAAAPTACGRDPDTLERLFHLYNHAKRPQDARRTLEQLRELRPDDPQLDLYELDLIEVKGLNDIERLLTDIEQIADAIPATRAWRSGRCAWSATSSR